MQQFLPYSSNFTKFKKLQEYLEESLVTLSGLPCYSIFKLSLDVVSFKQTFVIYSLSYLYLIDLYHI